MAESEVVKAIRKQREEITRNERDTLKRMAKLWVPSYKYLQKQVNALTALIQQKRDKGEPVEIEYLYSLDRYKTMMAQAKKMIRDYNKAIAGQIRGTEAEMVDIGHRNAKQIINIAEPDDPLWTRVNKRETRIMAAMTADETPLDNLLAKSFGQMKEGMESALITGISTGQGSSLIADQLMKAAEIPEQRALLIARTEVNRTYRQSNWEQMRSSRAILGYRRMCYKDTACFACLMLDKEFYPVDSEPTDHPNGKCSFVPVTRHFDPGADPGWESGRDWFEHQDPDTQRSIMGPGRFDLWKRQGVNPRDMVWIKPNKVWGGSPAIRPLEELKNSSATASGYRGLFSSIFDKSPKLDSVLASDSVEQDFPEWEKDENLDLEQAIKGTNLNAQDETIPSWMYRENCQKCVPTWELRRRGFLVEALPLTSEDDFYTEQDNWSLVFKNSENHIIDNLPGSGKKDIVDLMKQWGNGSRAEIAVKWEDGSGHIFAAENVGGKIVFIDPQWGIHGKEVEQYFIAAAQGLTKILRIDNLEFSSRIHDCATGAKK